MHTQLQKRIYKMDIVSRLKTFINHINVPVTQFADNCNIARPTLSQLLNGRNKKVSDELIGKIHDAYPMLSVLWLMFGEGDMLHGKNNEISEPQTPSIFDLSESDNVIDEQVTPSIDFNKNFAVSTSEKFETESTPSMSRKNEDFNNSTENSANDNTSTDNNSGTITFNPDHGKKIVNIIIYYSDNSFESFVPNNK